MKKLILISLILLGLF
jgi:hypothetical protein